MKPDPIEVAKQIWKDRYPRAKCIFVAGSIFRGEGTEGSDIDIVVLFEALEHGYRESFYFSQWPIEVFVHDKNTLAYFIENDRIAGFPALANMISEGNEITSSGAYSTSITVMPACLM